MEAQVEVQVEVQAEEVEGSQAEETHPTGVHHHTRHHREGAADFQAEVHLEAGRHQEDGILGALDHQEEDRRHHQALEDQRAHSLTNLTPGGLTLRTG